MNDIQQIGLVMMLLPILAMLILLAFATVQLALAVHADRTARNARKPNRYMRDKALRL